jgi:hypothetical protein
MKKDYYLLSIKKRFRSLRFSLARKAFGTDIEELETGYYTRSDGLGGYVGEDEERLVTYKAYFLTITTTQATGHFSKKSIKAKVELSKAFKALNTRQQENKILAALKENL